MKPQGNSWDLGAFLSRNLDEYGLDPFAFRVWLHLCRRANDEQRTWPAVPSIAKVCRMSERRVQIAIAELEGRGFFHREERKREDGGRTSDMFVLHGVPGLTPGASGAPGGAGDAPAPAQDVHRPGAPRAPKGIPEEVDPTLEGTTPLAPQGKKGAKNETELPADLALVEGLPEAWGDWLAHRRELRCALTPHAATEQFKKLRASPDPVRLVRHSLGNGWRGLFEPKPDRPGITRLDVRPDIGARDNWTAEQWLGTGTETAEPGKDWL